MSSRIPPRTCTHWWRLLCVACVVVLSRPLTCAAATEPAATRSSKLPAGAAEQSLKLFSQQAGKGIVIGAEVERGVRTNAVRGVLTSQDALQTMLVGTGFIATCDEKSGAFAI